MFQLCLASFVAAASAAAEVSPSREEEPIVILALRWIAIVAGVALVLQLLLLKASGANSTEHAENKDPSLTYREDEGITKLVPLLPEPKGVRKDPLVSYTMEEVSKHDTREDLWVIVDGRAYDLTKFVDKHPGGFLPIVDMAGKDCTDVFANYHAARVYKHMLPPFLVGEVSDFKVPPHVKDFRAIRQELLRRGLFETDMRSYAKLGTWLLFLYCCALLFSLGNSLAERLVGAFVMGIFWQQLAGIGHDLGHSGVTHKFRFDHILGSALASLMGISTCWWKRNHNTHHVVCNSVEHDPDIQHLPLFAVTPKVIEKPYWSTYYSETKGLDMIAKFLVSYQHVLFYPIMMVARFNLHAQSWIQLLSKEPLHYRKLEMCALGFYHIWVMSLAFSMPTWRQTLAWLLVSHGTTALLHVQITISHWCMETYTGYAYNDAQDEWYITQLKTTMNVLTPHCLDWLHIGLQFQIEHHLYPRLPRHNLRKARELVKAVCAKHDIPYTEHGFFKANWLTLEAMYKTALVARQGKKGASGFFECALWDGLTLSG